MNPTAPTNPTALTDPFAVLGLSPDAGEAEVRARYLELVKQYPPQRDAEKFREIRAAFDAAKDPLSIARRHLLPPGPELPSWSAAIDFQAKNPPRLSPGFLLSLGNRDGVDAAVS